MDFLVEYWHWIVFGLLLIAMELMLFPGSFFLWVGITAIFVGFISYLIPLSLGLQLLIFSPLAILVTWYGKVTLKKSTESDAPLLNRRSDQLIGMTIVLSNPIVNGSGQTRVGDSVWQVRGPDLEAGNLVVIRRVDGSILIVDPVIEDSVPS